MIIDTKLETHCNSHFQLPRKKSIKTQRLIEDCILMNNILQRAEQFSEYESDDRKFCWSSFSSYAESLHLPTTFHRAPFTSLFLRV
jgi:hypothetical protein